MEISVNSLLALLTTPLFRASEEVKREVLEYYARHLFPHPGTSVDQTRWWTQYGITRVTLWGKRPLRNNIRLALFAEALGLGPRLYCIMRTGTLGFSEGVYLLAQFLPHEKICLYPFWSTPLGGPFERSPKAHEIGVAISYRRIPMDKRPHNCFICYE